MTCAVIAFLIALGVVLACAIICLVIIESMTRIGPTRAQREAFEAIFRENNRRGP